MTCTCKPYYECPECEAEPVSWDDLRRLNKAAPKDCHAFTVDSLARALREVLRQTEQVGLGDEHAAAIIQAAKEAERE